MTTTADVLAKHTIECTGPGEVTCAGCRDRGWMSWTEYRKHLALALEPEFREREAQAWAKGYRYCNSDGAEQWINPYRKPDRNQQETA